MILISDSSFNEVKSVTGNGRISKFHLIVGVSNFELSYRSRMLKQDEFEGNIIVGEYCGNEIEGNANAPRITRLPKP